ncbi:MAG: 3-keto-5-aminohexanoate cleavage protein [Pseudomonadota bacterium]
MIVQACLNGARPNDFHPALPVSVHEIAADGARCVAQGAAELHVHPRDETGRESLAAVDGVIRALRRSCPGTLVGVSTGAWIEGSIHKTRERIAAWRALPDYASVNLAEEDAPILMALLDRIGVGIEAGLATVADAERFASLPQRARAFRILLEIEYGTLSEGNAIVDGICRVLDRAGVSRPLLLHGFDETVWHFVERARRERWSTRIGLEDGAHLRNGDLAADNSALVADAVALYRE